MADSTPWQVIGASVPGPAHVRTGLGCQDASKTTQQVAQRSRTYRSESPLPLFCAVADGAGSRWRSAEAANLAVGILVDAFLEIHATTIGPADRDATDVETARHVLDRAMRTACRRHGEILTVLAMDSPRAEIEADTTLAGVWLHANFVGIVMIGDASVVVERADDIALVGPPEQVGEYANQTRFVRPDADESTGLRLLVVYDPEISAVALATDGLADLAMTSSDVGPDLVAHKDFYRRLFSEVRSGAIDKGNLVRFLGGTAVTERSGDDVTLIVGWRPVAGADGGHPT